DVPGGERQGRMDDRLGAAAGRGQPSQEPPRPQRRLVPEPAQEAARIACQRPQVDLEDLPRIALEREELEAVAADERLEARVGPDADVVAGGPQAAAERDVGLDVAARAGRDDRDPHSSPAVVVSRQEYED